MIRGTETVRKSVNSRAARIIAASLALLMLCALFTHLAVPASALDAPAVSNCEGAYLYNFENDEVLFEKDINKKLYPTSSVKIMTGIVAIEALGGDLDRTVTVTKTMMSAVSGNNVGYAAGDSATVRDLLYALLLNGANDAAYILAQTVSATTAEFVAKMNARASEIGALATNFTNPTGMHDDSMLTTVADMVKIAKFAYTLPLFMDITSTVSYKLSDGSEIWNRNCMITKYYEAGYYYSGARGLNAGSTPQGGHCVITTASNGELSYLAVVMGAEKVDTKLYSYIDAALMLDWAFKNYAYIDVLPADKIIKEMPVTLSSAVDYITIVPEEALRAYLPLDTDVDSELTLSYYTYSEELCAPVLKGDVVGVVTVSQGNAIVGSCQLIATGDVPRSDFLYALSKIEEFAKSRFFICTAVSAVVLSVVYVIVSAMIRGKRGARPF